MCLLFLKRPEMGLRKVSLSHFKLNPVEQWRHNSKASRRKVDCPRKQFICFQIPRFGGWSFKKMGELLSSSVTFLSFLLVSWCHENPACPEEFERNHRNTVYCLGLSKLLSLITGFETSSGRSLKSPKWF